MSKNLKLQKTGKRHLYLDRNKKFFIEFDLEKTKTCEEIYKSLQNEIEKKIKEIYKNQINQKKKYWLQQMKMNKNQRKKKY